MGLRWVQASGLEAHSSFLHSQTHGYIQILVTVRSLTAVLLRLDPLLPTPIRISMQLPVSRRAIHHMRRLLVSQRVLRLDTSSSAGIYWVFRRYWVEGLGWARGGGGGYDAGVVSE